MPRRAIAALLTACALAACGGNKHSSQRTAATAGPPTATRPTATRPAAAPRLTNPHPCPTSSGFTCASLAVPLDHAGQAAGTLALSVGVQDGPAPKGVLVFLTGGPGQPGVPFLRRVHAVLGAAMAGYRLVMLDQRGTGGGALLCPAAQRISGSSDLIDPGKAALDACARTLGPGRRFYATSETVEDLEQLRQALHVRQLVLDGVSYGTFVAERYAVRHPTAVRALVLDSVVPHDGLDPLYAAALHDSSRVLRALCAGTCGFDPVAAVAELVRTRHIGPVLLRALVAESVYQPSYPGVLAAIEHALEGRDGELDTFLRDGGAGDGTTAPELSQGLHDSTLCADLRPWAPAASRTARAALLQRLATQQPVAALFPFDRATAVANGLAQTCLDWPPTRPPALPTGNLDGLLPPVPTLLLAGGHDLSTPLSWARHEAALAPRGQLFEVPDAGHSVQLRARNTAARAALARFLGAL